MTDSLLAYLYTRIKGSQEDIATESLKYILSKSYELSKEFTKFILSKANISIEKDFEYSTQVVGENNERPDMVGKIDDGTEILLFEMKFYAALTENQPLGYIRRLKEGRGRGLVFICPEKRLMNLWNKIKSRLVDRNLIHEISEKCVSYDDINVAILSWREVISMLQIYANDDEIRSDLLQLDGYCRKLDDEAFIPFTEKDLSVEAAIKEERYQQVIDCVYELLKSDKLLNAVQIGKVSPYKYGCERKIRSKDCTISICYDRKLWKDANSCETPFWVSFDLKNIHNVNDKFDHYKICHSCYTSRPYLALEAPENATLEEVSQSLVKQILFYIDRLK